MPPELRRLPSDKPVSDLVAALEEDGAVLIEGLLDPALLARLNAEVDDAVAAADPGMGHLNPAVDRTRQFSATYSPMLPPAMKPRNVVNW
jgi:hypothetical protein